MAPKRTASGKAPAAKRARGPEAPLLDFLGKCNEIPKPCREMLQVSVPICLEVKEDERHKFQVEVLERVAALLATVESNKREVVTTVQGELKDIQAERDTVAVDSEAKKATAESKQGQCNEKEKNVDAAREVSNDAAKALAEAQKAEAGFNTKKDSLKAEQENFAKLLSEVYQPLKDNTSQAKGAVKNKHLTELKKKLAEIGCQESLGDALVQTLKLTPEKREGSFAQVTLKFVDEAFNAHTEKVSHDLAGLDAEAAGHASAITAATATLDEKKAALGVEEKEWDAMQDEWVALDKEAATAARGLKSIEVRLPRAEKSIDKAQADLDKFLELLATFAKLKEKSTVEFEEPANEEKNEAEAENGGEQQDAPAEN